MAKTVRTRRLTLATSTKSVRPKYEIDIQPVVISGAMLFPPTPTHTITAEAASTTSVQIPTSDIITPTATIPTNIDTLSTPVEIINFDNLKITITTIGFDTWQNLKTSAYPFRLAPAKKQKKHKTRKIDFGHITRSKSHKSNLIANMPITRTTIPLSSLPYPVISDFIIQLAQQNKTRYTNISLLGVYDPIPVHLATNLTIDSDRGILKFTTRKVPQGEKRFVRLAFGRLRSTDEIVTATLPML